MVIWEVGIADDSWKGSDFVVELGHWVAPLKGETKRVQVAFGVLSQLQEFVHLLNFSSALEMRRVAFAHVELTDQAMKLLAKIGIECSLRYAIHLITTANLVAQKRKASEVDVSDIRKVYNLFVDVKRSTDFLKDYEKEFMFSNVAEKKPEGEDEAM